MTYEFKYTERNLERSSEFETKTLLFLLGIDPIRSQVCYLFIDCFNDISGSDKKCSILWDYQSKGVSNMSPRKIGESLLTLFENYSSELNFGKYALFMPKPKSSHLGDDSLLEFGIGNFGQYAQKVKQGLEAEFKKRNSTLANILEKSAEIDAFLQAVVFVIDRGKKEDYVKNIVEFKDKDLKPESFYTAIFDEVRQVQNNKKLKSIHERRIQSISDALGFRKHLKSTDISVLVVNRLVGADLFKPRGIPLGFHSQVTQLTRQDTKDVILECCIRISRAFFDKNSKASFWIFLENAVIEVGNSPSLSPQEIHHLITGQRGIKCRHLSEQAGIYLISLIQEGLEQ